MKAKLIFTSLENMYEFLSIGQKSTGAAMTAPRNMYLRINGRAVLCGDSPDGLIAGALRLIETLRSPECQHTYNNFLTVVQRAELIEIYNELKRQQANE